MAWYIPLPVVTSETWRKIPVSKVSITFHLTRTDCRTQPHRSLMSCKKHKTRVHSHRGNSVYRRSQRHRPSRVTQNTVCHRRSCRDNNCIFCALQGQRNISSFRVFHGVAKCYPDDHKKSPKSSKSRSNSMGLFCWIFDIILLACVAISTHYFLVQYIDNKWPLPPFLQDILKGLNSYYQDVVKHGFSVLMTAKRWVLSLRWMMSLSKGT